MVSGNFGSKLVLRAVPKSWAKKAWAKAGSNLREPSGRSASDKLNPAKQCEFQ